MSDESSPSKNTKNEYLEVKGPANTFANLMRPPIPHVSEMTGTFEKLKQLKEMIAGQNMAKETDKVDSVEDGEAGEDNTVTITINNTMHGQILTLEDSESEGSDSEEVNVINDIDPSKYTMLSDSDDDDDDEDEDDDDVVEIPLNKRNKRSASDPMIELLSPSDSEESSAVESDSEGSSVVEGDSPVQKKRQKLE